MAARYGIAPFCGTNAAGIDFRRIEDCAGHSRSCETTQETTGETMKLTWEQCRGIVLDLGFQDSFAYSDNWPRRRIQEAVGNAYRERNDNETRDANLPVEMATLVVAMILVSHGWPI